MEVNAPEMEISSLIDRMEGRPFGLLGGEPGAAGGIWIRRKEDTKFRRFTDVFGTASPSKFSGLKVHKGDQVLLITPGGGGFGPPLKRDQDAITEDVSAGFISLEAATVEYEADIDPDDLEPSAYIVERYDPGP